MAQPPQSIVQMIKPLTPSPVWRFLRKQLVERKLPPIAMRVMRDHLSFLGERALAELHEEVRIADATGRPGILVEAGCALGGSALVMADAKARPRELRIHDVFGFPPPPCERDGPDVHERWAEIASGNSPGIAGDVYYGYQPDLLAKVVATFRRYGFQPAEQRIEFVEGMLQDRLRLSEPVAVAHIDCDRYDSVRTCLDRIGPNLPAGGVMIIDDYHSKSGCRIAVDEFLAAGGDQYRIVEKSRLHIIRT